MSRNIRSGAPSKDVNILTGSSEDETLLADISARVIMMAPVNPVNIYVNLSLRPVKSFAM